MSRKDSCRGITLLELLLASTLGFVIILAIGNLDVTRVLLTREATNTASFQSQAQRVLFHMATRLEEADRINQVCDGDNNPGTGFGLCPDGEVATNIQIRVPQTRLECPVGSVPPDPEGCPGGGVVCVGCLGTVPPPCCFDVPGNYRWVQYRFDDLNPIDGTLETVRFFDDTAPAIGFGGNGCVEVRTLATGVNALFLTYEDEAATPPPGGSEPFPDSSDNNVIQVVMGAIDPATGLARTVSTHTTVRASAYTDLVLPGSQAGDSGSGLQAIGVELNPPPVPDCS